MIVDVKLHTNPEVLMKTLCMSTMLIVVLFSACSTNGDANEKSAKGDANEQIEKITLVSHERALALLRTEIEGAMRSEVWPGGNPSYGCYTWDHKSNFEASGKIRTILKNLDRSTNFIVAVASLRGSNPDDWAKDELARPVYNTWAMNGVIDDRGTTDAGYMVQQAIGQAIVSHAERLATLPATEWERFLVEHGFQLLSHDIDPEKGSVSGERSFPESSAEASTVFFAGFEWRIKESSYPVGPGPCIFAEENVFLDEHGMLHLKIAPDANGRWSCGEVICQKKEGIDFGYGEYSWSIHEIRTRDGELDPHHVVGLFTWSDSADFTHRELDVEVGLWGEDASAPAYQFVVQPWDVETNRYRFSGPIAGGVHSFTWKPDHVIFSSRFRDGTRKTWWYVGNDIPPPGGDVRPRINVWLLHGAPPAKELEVVFNNFNYTPLR